MLGELWKKPLGEVSGTWPGSIFKVLELKSYKSGGSDEISGSSDERLMLIAIRRMFSRHRSEKKRVRSVRPYF